MIETYRECEYLASKGHGIIVGAEDGCAKETTEQKGRAMGVLFILSPC
jgi:hypothetical protein